MEQQNCKIISDKSKDDDGESRKKKEFEASHSQMDFNLSPPSRGTMQPTKKKLRVYPLNPLKIDYSSKTPRVHPLKIDWTPAFSKTGRSKHDGDESSQGKRCEERHPKISLSRKQPTRRRKKQETLDCRKQRTRSVQSFIKEMAKGNAAQRLVGLRVLVAWPCEKEPNAGFAVRDTSYQADERATPASLCSICDSVYEAVEGVTPVSLRPICDGVLESMSHNSDKCSDYESFPEAEPPRCYEVVDRTSRCNSSCSAYVCFCERTL